MIDVGKMICSVRKERGMSQSALGAAIGVTEQTIANYESGRRKPKYEALEAIADILNCPIEFFVSRDEKRVQLKTAGGGTKLPQGIRPLSDMIHHYVPMVGAVAAGKPLYAEQNFDCVVDAPHKADYALKIEGDSMAPNILNGDTVFIQQMDDVEDGQIAVVLLDDSATLKHVFHMPDGLMLTSDNPNYLPMYIKFADYDYVRILGRLCGFVRMFY